MNFWPFIITLFLIAAAELGDKTQLLTLGFATRYPLWKVIGAVSAATAILMALAVTLGKVIDYYIPAFYIQLFAGIIFVIFGLWTLLAKEEKDGKIKKGNQNPFFIIFTTFFLAELGDKTQLATFTLSAKYGAPFQVWLGATLGMVGVNILAALAGSWINKIAPEKIIRSLGSIIFIVFGLLTLLKLFI